MKAAIDVSPLTSGHKVRGVGFYLKHLLSALKTYHPEHEYVEFTKKVPIADVVHYPYFDLFSRTLPLFPSKKTVVTIHDVTPLILSDLFPVGIKGQVQFFLQKKLVGKVGRVITDSKSSKKDIEKYLGISASKIDVAYLAAGENFKQINNQQLFRSVAVKYHLPNRFALYVGDATPNKNVLRLAQAAVSTHTPLVIAGKVFTDETVVISHPWTKEIAEVRKLAKMHPEKIFLLGFVSDEELVALYNMAKVFIMPSLYEGFGLPVVEAFACGCPVISTDKGSLKEVVSDAALLIDPYDVDAMAHAIEKVVGDTKLAKSLQAKGLVQLKHFSWKKTADATVSSYEKALSS